jgi:enolase
MQIESLSATEILDSRGRPTIAATCRLRGSAVAASASIPSGASTGSAEALELRDGDLKRYGGLGVRKAVANVNGEIAAAVIGKNFEHQSDLDRTLITLDDTPNKSRLGANAILAVSLAFSRAHATQRDVPLYQHFADMIGQPLRTIPRLTVNLFSGGKHAGAQVPIQDVLLVPKSADTIDDGLATVYAIYQCAGKLCQTKYNARPLKADEGGLAPPFPGFEEMLDDAVAAIRAAGFEPGRDVALAVDVASSHFYRDGVYELDANRKVDAKTMLLALATWLDRWPIVSVEDALDQDAWNDWPELVKAIGARSLVLGDDFLCTSPQRIRRAIELKAANALLLKVNQIGTLTEAAEALKLARNAGWRVTISARSGETEDNWLADLAVGWAGDQIKVGSICQSERLAKYNRLLAIEAETRLPVVDWP